MRVGILGGGTLGLTLAYRFGQAGHHATVLEAAEQPGGLSTWFDYGDFVWDKYYHVILKQDEALLGLLDELGIGDRMRWASTQSGFLWRGRHLSMSNNWEFLTFPALNLFEKLRLGLGILYCQRLRDPAALETQKAPAWMQKVFGARVYEAIWRPLMESKYGVLTDEIPATIMWSTITRYYSTRSKSDGRESMGYLAGGGLKGLFDAFVDAIERQGGSIHCGRRATHIELSGRSVADGVDVHCGDETLHFDRVVSTLPSRLLSPLAPGLDGLVRSSEIQPRFLGVIRVALVLRRPLSPYYVTNLIQKGFPFTGIIEVSAMVAPEELAGRSFVMLPLYEVPDSPWFERSEDEISTHFVDALKPIWPDIHDNLVATHVHRERLVQALWIDAPPPAESQPLRNADGRVWNVNAELAGRDTLNNNAVVDVANRAARHILEATE